MITSQTQQLLSSALSSFNDTDSRYLRGVADVAISLHEQQAPRPSGERYENHIVRVAARIVNDFHVVDKDLFIAGLLHDSVEDQLERLVGTPSAQRDDAFAHLETTYSKRVSEAVKALSNPEEYETAQDRSQKNDLYIAHVIDQCNKSVDCFIVKLSDFFDNAMQLQLNESEERRIKGARKYMPLFTYFSDTLRSDRNLPIDSEVRHALAHKIDVQKEYADGLVALQ